MFLPSFSAFLLAAVLCLSAACGGPVADEPAGHPVASSDPGAQQAGARPPVATVLAGTGEVAAEWMVRIEAAVREELPRLLPLFDGKPKHRFFVHVHAAREALPDSLAAHLHAESPAFAMLGQHQIHMVVGEIRRLGVDLHGVVRHELVHELLDQYAAPHGRGVPRWFHEGLAQHLAGDTYLWAREDDLAWRLVARRLRAFGELRSQFPSDVDELRSAYAQSYSYVSWLVREFGLGELLAVVRAVDDLTTFEPALAGRLGRPTVELEEAWRHYVLHGSGAPWRVLFGQCFSLSLLAILPLLVLALRRHLAKEDRAARLLVAAAAQAAALPAVLADPAGSGSAPPSADAQVAEDHDDPDRSRDTVGAREPDDEPDGWSDERPDEGAEAEPDDGVDPDDRADIPR